MHRDGKHVLSHAAIYLVARGLPGVMAFLAIPLFTRLLSPADFGRYALVVSWVMLLNALLFQWLRMSLVRYLPAYHDDPARLASFKSTLLTWAAVPIVVLGLAPLATWLVPPLAVSRSVTTACWVLLAAQALFDLYSEHARATLRPWSVMGMQLTRSVVSVGLGGALAVLGWGWWGPLAGLAVGMFLACAVAWRRDWSGVRLGSDRQTLARVSRYGLPLAFAFALTVVIGTSDRFLIAWKLGTDAAGLYSAASDFTTQTLTLLMLVINLAVFPLAVRAWEKHGREAAREQMRINAALLLAVGVPCVIGLSVLAPGIAHCFLGKSFREAGAALMPLVALGAFLAGLKAYHFDAAFQFADRTIHQVWIVLFAAVLNVALNLALIPVMGLGGAVVASVLAYVASIALTAAAGRRHFDLPFPVQAAAQVLLAGCVMGGVLWPFRGYRGPAAVAAQIAGGAAVYAIVLAGANFMGLKEQLRRAFRLRFSGRAPDAPDERNASAEADPTEVPTGLSEPAAAVS